MKKLIFSALTYVAFTFSGFASNEVENEFEKTFKIDKQEIGINFIEFTVTPDERNYCDLKFITVNADGEIVITIKRGYGYNLDCDKEQAKVDKLNEKKIGLSRGDFRNL